MSNLARPDLKPAQSSFAADKGELEHVSRAIPMLESNKSTDNYVPGEVHFADDDEHRKTSWKSWAAVGACVIAIYAQVFVVVACAQVIAFIARDLAQFGNVGNIGWVIQAPVLVQSVLSPVYGRVSDVLNRRYLAALPPILAAVGAIVAAKAESINMLIGGSILIGFALPTIAIVQAIPSEILPLRYRGLANGICYMGGGLASFTGGPMAGALVKTSSWRNIFWIQVGLHVLTTVSLLLAYRPVKNNKPRMPLGELLWACDPIGILLLSGAATLTLIALNWAPAVYPWSSARVLGLLVVGIVMFIAFGLYEWKGRSDGMINHVLFKKNKNFALAAFCFAVEGFLFYGAVNQFTNQIVLNLGFETDAFLITIRQLVFGGSGLLGSAILTYWATKRKDLVTPLQVSFASFLGACIAYATINPSALDKKLQLWLFNILAGFGQAGPLTLIPALIQFTAPPALLGTATGLSFSARAIGGAFGSAIMGTVITSKLESYPEQVGSAAVAAGLPESSVESLLAAFSQGLPFDTVPGATEAVISAATNVSQNVYAGAYRVGWAAIIPFTVLAMVCVFFLKSVASQMSWHTERPLDAAPAAAVVGKDHDGQAV